MKTRKMMIMMMTANEKKCTKCTNLFGMQKVRLIKVRLIVLMKARTIVMKHFYPIFRKYLSDYKLVN